MSDTAKLTLNIHGTEQTIELPVVIGTEGERGIDISSLLGEDGPRRPRPRVHEHGLDAERESPSSTARRASSATGASPSSSSARSRPSSRRRTCIIYGKLPNKAELSRFSTLLTRHSMIHEDMKRFFDGYPSTAHPMAILSAMVCSLSSYYPDALDVGNKRAHRHHHRPAPLQGAHHRGVLVQEVDRAALRLPAQLALVLRQLPQHDVLGPGRALRDRRGRGEGAEPAPRPPRRSRAELFHLDRAPRRQLQGQPLRVDRRRHLRPLGPAPRRRQPGGRGDARDHPARRRRRAEVRQPRQGQVQRLQADGLRPPRLQELRPARPPHQGRRRQGARQARHPRPAPRHRPQARGDRAQGSRTSSSASSTPTSTSTAASSTGRSASPRPCSPSCSRSVACPAGSPTGRR